MEEFSNLRPKTRRRSRAAPRSISLLVREIWGITGSVEEFRGSGRTRDGQIERAIAGSTGSLSNVDLDRLDPENPPGDVPRRRWAQFLHDTGAFRASGFADQARALG